MWTNLLHTTCSFLLMTPETCFFHPECPRHVPSIIQSVFAQGQTSWAIVKFHTEDEAQLALGKLDGFHDRLGTRLQFRIASAPQAKPTPPSTPPTPPPRPPSTPPPSHLLPPVVPVPKKRPVPKAKVFRVQPYNFNILSCVLTPLHIELCVDSTRF